MGSGFTHSAQKGPWLPDALRSSSRFHPPNSLPRRTSVMAEASARTARISMKDVRASVRRVQSEGERIVGRLRRDAQSLISRTRRDSVSDLLADALKFEQTIRKRAEKAIEELEERRARIMATFEEQAGRLVET